MKTANDLSVAGDPMIVLINGDSRRFVAFHKNGNIWAHKTFFKYSTHIDPPQDLPLQMLLQWSANDYVAFRLMAQKTGPMD
jgi:hypothetical protein